MQRIFLVFGLLIILTSGVSGQCPTPGYSVPDSVCSGAPFTLTNTSTGGQSYYWDLCPGDLEGAPAGSDITQTLMHSPQQMKMVTDNGNYFLFVANFFGGNLIRYDFGNSTDNVPTEYNYGNVGGVLSQPVGIDLVEENGNWHAIMVNYNLNSIVRVDFGNDISANTATGTDLGSAGLNGAIAVKVAKDNNEYYAFVANNFSTNITHVSFGNSITNIPGAINQISHPDFATNWGIDVIYDCVLGKWILFCASFDRGWINVIDFGTSLSNAGSVMPPLQSIDQPTGVVVMRDGVNWHLLVTSLISLELENQLLAGPSLNTSSISQVYTLGLTSPRGLAFARDSLDTKVFICSNGPAGLKKAVFQKPCNALPAISTDPASVTAAVTGNGYYNITLEVMGANGITAVYADSVYLQANPEANFVAMAACDGQPVVFIDSSIVDTNLVTTWEWDFGDSSPVSILQNPIHTFPGLNTYAVTLTTLYNTGCFDTYTESVTVNELPDAAFSFVNNQCLGVPVTFTDLSIAFFRSYCFGMVLGFRRWHAS